LIVYYSTLFTPYRDQIVKLTSESKALLALFKAQYEIWIGYHAILQENSRAAEKEPVEPEVLERVLEAERTRVAQMQVKQARTTSEFMKRAMRDDNATAAEG